MTAKQTNDIKKQKGDFWSRPGAAAVYERGVSSVSPFIQIKNEVERTLVLRHAKGYILDAGTGTGRFAIPLAKVTGNSVVAFDYSDEMLQLNRQLSRAEGVDSIRYLQGDVEHLPFEKDHFDSVVSVTVVRHFPQWRAILKEYIRVTKPGGKIVFEMCSGDHIEAANRVVARFGAKYSKDGFLSYEAEVRFDELREWLDANGVDLLERHTYDFLNNNCFLKIATFNQLGYRVLLKAIKLALTPKPLYRLAAWLELTMLSRLPPVYSYNYMVIGRKR
ncbi:MAG: class I SAM-dependent methyltransferase [Burkholderiales bacterium]|jgi:ubiquinone/menaquinone biosynthesis C-methylase UbiE|nr:class I SAM-dependent methyltransferase [Burkholderiales bacterium]